MIACRSFLDFGGGASVSACSFCKYGLVPHLEIISPKNGIDVCLKWHLSLFNFRFPFCIFVLLFIVCFHGVCNCYHTVPINIISNAKSIGFSFNIPSILSGICCLLEQLEKEVAFLYLPNWHENVVKYGDCSSNLMLWYLELAAIRDKYFVFISFGNISFKVGIPWTGCFNTSFNLAGLRHSLAFPLGLGTSTKLLHYSAVLSITPGIWLCLAVVAVLVFSEWFCRA